MRVIAGSARGTRLTTAEGRATRPTTDRVKEAMFSMIQFELSGANCLDGYAGSGALGIEALSRGAKCCDFVEIARKNHRVIADNLRSANLNSGRIHTTSLERFLSVQADMRYNIVFLDPPYAAKLLQKSLFWLIDSDKLAKNAIIVIEHNQSEDLPAAVASLVKQKDKRYGNTTITLYQEQT